MASAGEQVRTYAIESDFGSLAPKSEENRIQHPPKLGNTGGSCVSPTGEAFRVIATNSPVIDRRNAVELQALSRSQTGSISDDCATSLPV